MLERLAEIRAAMSPAYRDYLAGKRVVLVGPAASLTGRGRGEWIEAHDVVARMNLASPVLPENFADVGRGTDVLYHRLFDGRLAKAAGQDHSTAQVDAWLADGVEWLIASQARSHDRVSRILPILRERITFVTMEQSLPKIKRMCGVSSPSLGTIAILHLLASDLVELNVTGCDFYASTYYVGYGGFTADQAARGTGGTLWGQGPALGGRATEPHPQTPQVNYLRALVKAEPRLVFDEVAMAALER